MLSSVRMREYLERTLAKQHEHLSKVKRGNSGQSSVLTDSYVHSS